MSAIHTLTSGGIDYAGLFPPAGLDMAAAAANYQEYRSGPAAWALGRFIVPATRLPELEATASKYFPRDSSGRPWRLSVLAEPELQADLEQVGRFNHRNREAAIADTIEVRATSETVIQGIAHSVPRSLQTYFEIPLVPDPAGLIAAIAAVGARAKVRTGGVTPEAFPTADHLAGFMVRCIARGVPFKATAGLHHPLRAEYRLTYAADSPCGTMFGFLNLFLAAAFLRAGMSESEAARLLEERSADAFRWNELGIGWRDHRLDLNALRQARQETVISFGSCSFTEPIGDLESLGLLQPGVQPA